MRNATLTHGQIIEKVKRSVSEGKPLVLTTNNFLRNIEDQLFVFIRYFLEELSLHTYEDMLIYAVRELAANANKANMKRLYFIEKNLDIENGEHYQRGMESFREEAYLDLDKYTSRLQQEGIYVKFRFHVKGDVFVITIVNNTSLSREEEERINDKIRKAWDFSSMEEAMMHILDGTEGAGLGIVSIIMMLRNLGITSRNALKIKKTPSETHSVMHINCKEILNRTA